MADLAAIRDFVREQTLIEIDDWSNAKLLNVINEGIQEVASRFRWPFLATSAQISVTAGTQAYSLSSIASNIQRIAAIIDNERRIKLQELDARYAWQLFGGDAPDSDQALGFYLWGETLYLLPTPSATEANAYTIFYYKSPTTLSNDTDTPEWSSQFHMLLADYAIARVWEREEDFQKAQAAQGRFDGRVEQMARHYLNRVEDEPLIFGEGKYSQRRQQAGNLILD